MNEMYFVVKVGYNKFEFDSPFEAMEYALQSKDTYRDCADKDEISVEIEVKKKVKAANEETIKEDK